MAKVAQSWAWDRHGHAQPGLWLLHGVLGMGEEDREGRDHGVKCVLGGPEGSWELWKKEGIEQAGPRVSRVSRCGVSGQKPLTMGAAEMAGNLPRKAGSSPPNTPGWPRSGCQPGRFGLHSASLESGVLVSLTLEDVSELREGIRFSVLFPCQREADLQQDGLR